MAYVIAEPCIDVLDISCVSVCPVEECITMEALAPGMVDERTGQVVSGQYANWTTHPNNPARVQG